MNLFKRAVEELPNLKDKQNSTLIFVNFTQYLPFLNKEGLNIDYKNLRERFITEESLAVDLYCNLTLNSKTPKSIWGLKKWLEMNKGFNVLQCPTADEFLMFVAGKVVTSHFNINGEGAKSLVIVEDFSQYTLRELENLLKFIKMEIDRNTLKDCLFVTSSEESKEHLSYLRGLYYLDESVCQVTSGIDFFLD